MRYNGEKTWLITGISSGFGYEIIKQLLVNGDTVVGTVRNADKVKELAAQYPDTLDIVECLKKQCTMAL